MTTQTLTESWTHDGRAEQVVSSIGLDFEYTLINPSEIDRKASRVNRARIEPINSDVAKEYAASLENGSVFPAIVVCKLPDNEDLVIAGGNHRDEAWSCVLKRQEPILAIKCFCDRMEFDLLCKALNAVEGVRASTELRVMQAAEEVEQWGVDATDAARRLNVPVHRVTKLIDLNRWRAELLSKGYKIPPSTPETALLAVKQFASERAVLHVAMELVKLKVSGQELKLLVARAKDLDSESARVQMLTEYCNGVKPKKKTGVKRPNYNRILDGLSRVENVISSCTAGTQLQIPETEVQDVLKRCEAIVQRLKTLTSGSLTQGTGSKRMDRKTGRR